VKERDMRLHHWLMAYPLAVLLPLLVVSPVAAQAAPETTETAPAAAAPTAPPGDEAKKEASSRFRRGVELFQEGAYRAALVEFEKAYEIAPDYRLLYNIGQTKLQIQDYLGATQSYEGYLTQGGGEVPQARRDDVEKQLEALRERVGRIAITANKTGAEIFIDDLRVGVTPMSMTVSVNVGQHRVYGKARDGATDTEVIDVAGGELKEVKLELTTPEVAIVLGGPVDKPMTSMQKGAIGAWAGAGAAAIGAIVLGIVAKGKTDDLNKANDTVGVSPSKVKGLRDDADMFAITSDVFSGLAIAAGVTGTVLWFMDPGDEEKKPTDGNEGKKEARVKWGVGLGSISARGHF